MNGSLDGEYFSQDRMTVLAGRLPAQRIDQHGGAHARHREDVRDRRRRHGQLPVPARWTRRGRPTGTPFIRSYRVAAIVEIPPALVDESDQAEGSILPPGATRQLLPEYFYAWIGLRLARGTAGIRSCRST